MGAAVSSIQEVGEVKDTDVDAFRAALSLHDAGQATAAHAKLALDLAHEHGERIGGLDNAMLELRTASVNARVETNTALREMSEKFGALSTELRARSKVERAAVFFACCAVIAIAVLMTLQYAKVVW